MALLRKKDFPGEGSLFIQSLGRDHVWGHMHTHMMRVTMISYIVSLWSDLKYYQTPAVRILATLFKVSENLLVNYFIHEKV